MKETNEQLEKQKGELIIMLKMCSGYFKEDVKAELKHIRFKLKENKRK